VWARKVLSRQNFWVKELSFSRAPEGGGMQKQGGSGDWGVRLLLNAVAGAAMLRVLRVVTARMDSRTILRSTYGNWGMKGGADTCHLESGRECERRVRA
jgi:hypothetical protein